jgi:hypothetical protein
MPLEHEVRSARTAPLRVAATVLLGTMLTAPLTVEAATTRTPTGGGGTVVLEPVPPSESRRVWRRLVFTCTSPGLVVFSDRPCGPLPIVHELKGHAPRESPATAGSTPTVVPPKPAASVRPASFDARRDDGPDEAAQREATCHRLQEAVRRLDDRMRAGYSAREAALLWSRWREAKERLREADCRSG